MSDIHSLQLGHRWRAGICEEIVRFVKIHDVTADAGRRAATSYGVMVDNIRRHLLESLEGLTHISRAKVYYLHQPARLNTTEAGRHKDAVDVRVGSNCFMSAKKMQWRTNILPQPRMVE